jgi:hypothetical protein
VAFLAFLGAALVFVLVAFGVSFPTDETARNLAAGLFLLALGLLLPGAITLYTERRP